MNYRLLLGFVLAFLVMVLAACGEAGGSTTSSSGGQQVQITETDFKITSSITTFTPGISYHFVITNNGQTTHEFMLMPKSEGSMNGMTMADMDALALAKVQNIAPGQTVTLDYTFPSSAAGSHPEFACYQPGHYEAGMKLGVTVGS
jgi:uncharacterized cupredoxin-like copper-binding protein